MRKIFSYVSVTLCVVLVLACAVSIQAGDISRYVISAKAGGVSFVTGDVTVTTKKDKSQAALTTKDKLEDGDIINTGSDGRAEITLNPGSYLRIGENSSVELTTTNLDNLRLQIFKGSAVFETTGGEDLAILVQVNTPLTKVNLVKKGIYRLNVTSEMTEVQVWKGLAEVGNGVPIKVKGNKLIVGSANAGLSKLDKKTQDSLDLWSKDRAKLIAKERNLLERKAVWSSMSGFYNSFGSMYSGFPFYGAWLYYGRTSCYYFIPFDPWSWSSPYGLGYFNAGFDWSFFRLLPRLWDNYGNYYCPYTCGNAYYPSTPNVIVSNNNGSSGSVVPSSGPTRGNPIKNNPDITPIIRNSGPPLSSPPISSPPVSSPPIETRDPGRIKP